MGLLEVSEHQEVLENRRRCRRDERCKQRENIFDNWNFSVDFSSFSWVGFTFVLKFIKPFRELIFTGLY